MPRTARVKSSTGIYHIMLRGINRQQIFEDEEDRQRFIETLAKYCDECAYTIYAYCLMGNHVHILLKDSKEELATVLKRIAGSYAYWYNWKYRRSGHLFQDRFNSEPVEDDAYFLTVLRYIHQNPVKAGVCKKNELYPYSSYLEYISTANIVETKFVFSILTEEQFIDYHNQQNDDQCMEMEEHFRLTDDEAKAIIRKTTKCKTITEFQALDAEKRNEYIRKLHSKGLSIRQISRLTGISKKIVEVNI